MLKILDKCFKCNNSCKVKSEINASIDFCPNYISKIYNDAIKSPTNHELKKAIPGYDYNKKRCLEQN